jgi:hypothetical protein
LIVIPAGEAGPGPAERAPDSVAISVCDWHGVGETTDLMAVDVRRVDVVRAPE